METTEQLRDALEWALWRYYIRRVKELSSTVKAKEEVILKCTVVLSCEPPTDASPTT